MINILKEIGTSVRELNDTITAEKQADRDALTALIGEKVSENDDSAVAQYQAFINKITADESAHGAEMVDFIVQAKANLHSVIVDDADTGLIAIANAFVAADEELDSALETSQVAKVSRWETRIALEGNYESFLGGWDSYVG